MLRKPEEGSTRNNLDDMKQKRDDLEQTGSGYDREVVRKCPEESGRRKAAQPAVQQLMGAAQGSDDKKSTMTPLMVTTRMFPTTIRSNMLYHEQEAEAAARFWLLFELCYAEQAFSVAI